MGTQGINLYKPLQSKPQLSKPTAKEQQNFDNLIDFTKKEIKLGNQTIQYTSIELYDANNDGVFTDGEHLKVTTTDGKVILLHNFKNREDFEATKNNYSTNFNAQYQGSTSTQSPRSYDFLTFTQNKETKSEVPVPPKAPEQTPKADDMPKIKISRNKTLSEHLNFPSELYQNEHFRDFISGLGKNRQKIQEITKLTDEEYVKLSQLAIAVIQAETKSGEDKKGKTRIRGYGCTMRNWFVSAKKEKRPSQGISNIKVEDDKHLHKQYKALGITIDCPSNIDDNDELAAAATIIKLQYYLKHDYPIYKENSRKNGVSPERILTETEYITARWKNMPVLEKRTDGIDTTSAENNTSLFLDFRNNPNNKPDKGSAREILYFLNKYKNTKN